MPTTPPREEAFLAGVNRRLPPGVDWKQGAITYLREVVTDGGPSVERYHLVKPFVGGPDYSSFWVDAFHFLDLIEQLDLPMRSRIIDVGCGPGWTIHWLCKLGHRVVGCDISQELLDVAELRMKSDPYPPFVGEGFDYELRTHDVEEAPLALDEPADVAIFESTLHHFFNPVAVLRNISADLTPDGVIGVIEAAAPPEGSEWDRANLELMDRFHTIERPYTRDQLLEMLDLAGFAFCELYRPVNGLCSQRVDAIRPLVEELATADNINIVIASRTEQGLARVVPHPRATASQRTAIEPVAGFHGEETRPDGSRFRWAEPRAVISNPSQRGLTLSLSAPSLPPLRKQRVVVVGEGRVASEAVLSGRRPKARLEVPAGAGRILELHSDRAFSPAWSGAGDTRLLSFMVEADSLR